MVLLSADGALEAAPAMGAADIILDLVSTGVTLRENNLKELQGGNILEVWIRCCSQCRTCFQRLYIVARYRCIAAAHACASDVMA